MYAFYEEDGLKSLRTRNPLSGSSGSGLRKAGATAVRGDDKSSHYFGAALADEGYATRRSSMDLG
jgi:hypothetical protein